MKPLLLTVGNIYLDLNVFEIDSDKTPFVLEAGKDYMAARAERVLGGSAVNAAMQAARLGVEVGFIGKTGNDDNGAEVRALLEKEGILSELVSSDSSLATSMAINLIDKNGQFLGVHYGNASKSLATEDVDLSNGLFERSQAIYFGGTAKQPKLLQNGEKLFAELHAKGIKIFYDPNRFPVQEEQIDRNMILAQLRYVEDYMPNEDELFQLTSEESVDTALETVLSTGVKFVALKLGEKGCRIKSRDEDFIIEGKKITPVTTVGAGACFNATFIAFYLKSKSLKECAEFATTAAAIKVSQNIWPDEVALQNYLVELQ